MNADFLINMVRPYLPTISNKFLPRINEVITEAIEKENATMRAGETETVFMLNSQDNTIYLRTVWLNSQAQVVRSSAPQKLTDYLQAILDQALNTK